MSLKPFAETVATRMLLVQVIAYIAKKEEDPAQIASDLRAATLRSLDFSMSLSSGSDAAKTQVNDFARSIIEDTYDTIGRLLD